MMATCMGCDLLRGAARTVCAVLSRMSFMGGWRAQAWGLACLIAYATRIQLVRCVWMGCGSNVMVQASPRCWNFRRFAAWMMLLALVMRLPAPEGWMPNVSGSAGDGFIVICTVHGQMTMRLDGDGNPVPIEQDDERGSKPQPPCAFAGLGGLGAAPPSPVAIAAPSFTGLAQPIFDPAGKVLRRHHGPAEARGPPTA